MTRLVIFSILLLSTPALAYDEADWIGNDPDPAVSGCCGPQDCSVLPEGAVTYMPGEYVVRWYGRTFRVPESRKKPNTHDGRWWLCVNWPEDMNPAAATFRCLFGPDAGF